MGRRCMARSLWAQISRNRLVSNYSYGLLGCRTAYGGQPEKIPQNCVDVRTNRIFQFREKGCRSFLLVVASMFGAVWHQPLHLVSQDWLKLISKT